MCGPTKISILLPCYGQARFLHESVESVLAQDFSDWEVVASDDASPDDTHVILQKLARQDGRIRLFRQPQNLGMVENWNFCLRQARGIAIKLMGADDRLERPDCLSRQWQALQNPEVALVACARNILDENSQVIDTLANLPRGTFPAKALIPQMLEHQDNLIGEPVCCLFRRTDAARGFNLMYRQNTDIEMWLHLLEKGVLRFEGKPLVAFRTHPGQRSKLSWAKDQGWEHLSLILKHADSPEVPLATRLAVLIRSEEWLGKNPLHPGIGEITSLLIKLQETLSRPTILRARIVHHLRRSLTRWKNSLRKRLPVARD